MLLLHLEGCATVPETKFYGKWYSCENVPQEPMMCLKEQDLGNLRKLLLQCGAK